MRRAALFAVLALSAGAAAPGPPPLGITVTEAPSARLTTAVLPGRLVAATLPRGADGSRSLVLLVAPEEAPEGPRAVYRLDVRDKGSGTLVVLARGLPAAANALDALDLSGAGAQEVLLGEPGRIAALGVPGAPFGAPRTLAERTGLDLRAQPGGRPLAPPAGRRGLEIAEPGKLRLWVPAEGRLKIGAAWDLPLHAEREPGGLRLTSPPLAALRRDSGASLYAIGPEARGRRLHTLLIDTAEGGGTSEAWSRLPGAEEATDTWFALLDGRPVLLATAVTADRVAILERRRLRLFPLAGDRTRAGNLPSFAAPTTSRRWHAVEPILTDLDGDRRADLLVLQMDGLRDGELRIEAFHGLGNGRFEPRPRSQKLGGAADFWAWGEDFTGDRHPDLLVVAQQKLLLYAAAPPGGRILFEPKPRRTVPLGTAEDRSVQVDWSDEGLGVDAVRGGAPHLADLDGDGRVEVLFLTRSQRGRGVVRVVWLR
jgi:hypothetical protein